jgi:hypothetical protein
MRPLTVQANAFLIFDDSKPNRPTAIAANIAVSDVDGSPVSNLTNDSFIGTVTYETTTQEGSGEGDLVCEQLQRLTLTEEGVAPSAFYKAVFSNAGDGPNLQPYRSSLLLTVQLRQFIAADAGPARPAPDPGKSEVVAQGTAIATVVALPD